MKLVRFEAEDGPRIGLVTEDGVIDVRRAGGPWRSVLEIVASGKDALDGLRAIENTAAATLPLNEARLLAPIERPGKYLAIGLNYRAHIDETRGAVSATPAHQMWFNKQTTCISAPFAPIDPGASEAVDYEAELGVVIGKPAKNVSAQAALDHVFGYFVANDVTARDFQRHSATFTVGKSFDTHGPIGPWIVTADEIADPQALAIRCLVNGEIRQDSNTALMIHDIAHQIAYLASAFTLEPGDLLATGTPDGIGMAMKPPRYLQPGDKVRCEVDGVGAIESIVRRG